MNLQTIAYAKKLRFAKGKAQRKGKSASSGAYGLPDYKERVNADRAAYQGVDSLAELRAMMLGVHIFEFWYVQCTHARLAILKPFKMRGLPSKFQAVVLCLVEVSEGAP